MKKKQLLRKKDKNSVIFFTKAGFQVAKLIFDCPNKQFHIRMLEKKTGFSTTAVVDAVNRLKEFGIVQVERTPLTTNIKANLESDEYVFYKKIFNLYRLEKYALTENFRQAFDAKTIVLFGSFAKGQDIEESDIDLLIITNKKEKPDMTRLASVCEKELNRKLDLHVLPSLEKSSKEFKNAVANGIVLYGYLKVV